MCGVKLNLIVGGMTMANGGTPLINGANKGGTSLSEQVYQHLVDRIVRGEIAYGASLNIKEMAATLNVSPMPIRDAVKKLEGEGVAVVKPRSSCYVRTPSKRDVLQSIAARRMIELFVVSSIYQTISAEKLEPMRRIVEAMRGEIGTLRRSSGGSDDYHEARIRYIALDREYHSALCSLMNNAYVDKFYREINLHLNMQFRHDVGRTHSLEQTFLDHEVMLQALQENSQAIIGTLEAHLDRSRENIVNGELFQTLKNE